MKWLAVFVFVLLFVLGAIAQAQDYRVVAEKDNSFGNVRHRITLEIEIPSLIQPIIQTNGDLSRVMGEILPIMMAAGVDRHRQDWPDVVSIRLWKSYGDGSNAVGRLTYAPDGRSWAGREDTGELWTEFSYCSSYSLDHDMLHNCSRHPIPEDLADWGRPARRAP